MQKTRLVTSARSFVRLGDRRGMSLVEIMVVIAIIALFLFTGLRKKELLNLKLKDVNFERGYIRVFAKNKERRCSCY